MKKLKNGNKGFTMVELVVATAVLTVIMMPLMRAFVIASNTSRLTNAYGETSTAIKNVAELVTGASMSNINDLVDIEEKLKMFPAYDSTVLGFKKFEYDSTVSTNHWADYNTWVSSKTGLPASSSAFLENSKVFTLENANMGSGAGIMEVIVTPISSTASDGDMDYNEWYADVNSTNFASFTNMDVTMLQPGVAVETDGTKTVNTSVHADYRAATYFSTEIITNSSLDRNIEITLKKSSKSTDAKPMLTYDVKYVYTLDSTNTWDVTVFSGDAGYGEDGVCSIQIAYYPFYSSTTTTPFTATDRFTIVNTADLPVKLFLIKQDIIGFPLPVTDDSITNQHEINYKCSIYVEETTGTATNPTTRLYTNMNLNVSDSTSLSDLNFKYYFNNVEAGDAFKDRLVADDTGGRAFNVHVNAYQKKLTGTGYELIDQLTTVKLI